MNIIKAKVLGFCMGVRRAVELAVEEAKRSKDTPIYALGSLIHNPKVLDDLKALGVQTIDESLPIAHCSLLRTEGSTDNCSVIIRAHGVSPAIEKDLYDKGARIIDATCPNVKRSQLKVNELILEGYYLFLAGKKEHPEIKGLVGYACNNEQLTIKNEQFSDRDKRCFVVGSVTEAKKLAFTAYKLNNDAKTVLLGQTTISQKEYSDIGEAIRLFFPNLEIIDTICSATQQRQDALRDLLPLVEAVIIAGGKESANTQCLFEIAKESGKPCVLVEDAKEIPVEYFNFNTVGLCAGASTPDSVVDEIEKLFSPPTSP